MEKLKLRFILLTLLTQLVFLGKASEPPYGALMSIKYMDTYEDVLFVKWAVYLKAHDVFRFDDCKSLQMKNVKDRSEVEDIVINKGDLDKCIKELKKGCKPLSEIIPCKPLNDFFTQEDDPTEADNPSDKLEFGDLIAFHHFTKKGILRYMHWAVYVGKGKIDGLSEKLKDNDQDIFHIHRTGLITSGCKFDTMKKIGGKWKKSNYLDGREGWKPLDRKDIIDNIVALNKNCKYWDPLRNNCEHIATLVRYGKKNFEQTGALFDVLTKLKLDTFNLPRGKRGWQATSFLQDNSLPDQA